MTTKKHILGLGALLGTFFLILVSATTQIYHQDEYSWLKEMDKTSLDLHVHPPLYFLVGRAFGLLFGFNHERWVPAIFAIASLFLIYSIVKILTRRTSLGLLAAGLFVFNAYSILAATQIDIDGALLPFFVLLMYWGYLKILEEKRSGYWIFGLAILGGLFTKLSFVIAIGAILIDWGARMILGKDVSIGRLAQQYWKWFLGAVITLGAAYLVMGYFLPGVMSYALIRFRIFDFGHRAYFDLVFKILKSLVLLGPLLFLGGLAGFWQKDSWQKYRFWWVYLLFCTLFYAVIFDFTNLTIERYFMFMIVPFVILATGPIAEIFLMVKNSFFRLQAIVWASVVSILILCLPFLPQVVLPLNPKDAYSQHLLSGHWNFLIPISGGSGPIGFYVSALFIISMWGVALTSLLATRNRKEIVRVFGGAIFIFVGFFATVVVLEEFLFGVIYGSPNRIAWETLSYVNANPAIHQQQVITYYDIANYDLRLSGKYYSRFYTTPTRDYVSKVTYFRGYYMIVDFPAIGKDDRYWKLINRCPIEKEFNDKKVSSYIFDCRGIR